MTIKSIFEIYRRSDESRSQVIQRALTLAICKHVPVIIRTNLKTQPILVDPCDSLGELGHKTTTMQKMALARTPLWSVATFFAGGMLLWMLVSVTKWAIAL